MLRKKYQAKPVRKNKAHSRVWTAVMKGKEVCNKGSKRTIGSNSFLSFWHDKWMSVSTMRELVEDPFNRREDSLTIKDVTVDGGWNLATLSFNFLNNIYRELQNLDFQICFHAYPSVFV